MALTIAPPRPILLLTAYVFIPLMAGTAVGWLVGGAAGLLGMMLGAQSSIMSGAAAATWPKRGVMAALTVLGGVAGFTSAGRPVMAAAFVAAFCLVQVPLNAQAVGSGVALPIIVALSASLGLEASLVAVAFWLFVGFAFMTLVVSRLPDIPPQPGVSRRIARRHAIATAAAASLALYVVMARDISHGYWLVLTIVLVLRPVRGETSLEGWARTSGTIVGVLAAVAISVVLPTSAAVPVGIVCLFLGVAWTLAADVRAATTFITPAIVVLGSSGLVSDRVALALERVLFVLSGVVVAILAAWILSRMDDEPAGEPTLAG